MPTVYGCSNLLNRAVHLSGTETPTFALLKAATHAWALVTLSLNGAINPVPDDTPNQIDLESKPVMRA